MTDEEKLAFFEDGVIARELGKAAGKWMSRAESVNTGGAVGSFQGLMSAWIAADVTSAHEWIKAAPEGFLRERLIESVAMHLSKKDPVAAAMIVVTEIPPGMVHEEAVISVLHQWVMRDYDAACEWVDSFPESELKKRAFSELNEIDDYLKFADSRKQ